MEREWEKVARSRSGSSGRIARRGLTRLTRRWRLARRGRLTRRGSGSSGRLARRGSRRLARRGIGRSSKKDGVGEASGGEGY
jgi:hypothetical protein